MQKKDELEYTYQSECFDHASQRLLNARSNGNVTAGRVAAHDMLLHLKRMYDLTLVRDSERQLIGSHA